MNSELNHHWVRAARRALAVAVWAMLVAAPEPAFGQAAAKRKNPSSKLYVSDVAGAAQIETDDNIQDLNKRSVYHAEGTKIETKRQDDKSVAGKAFSTIVYSNGTGAYFDADTKVEVTKFSQEPFTPNRSDMDTEPSISQTQAFVSRGVVGLCTSKLVAGSSMSYQTSHGSINIRGRKVVIQATDRETKISMLDGESTVRGGQADFGGQVLKEGQQAIIRAARPGQPAEVVVQNIPPSETAALDEKVAMACMAKKSVYFNVTERAVTNSGDAAGEANVSGADAGGGNALASGSDNSGAANAGLVSAFDGPASNTSPAFQPTIVQEIQVVQVVPQNLPVEFTTSAARLTTAAPPGG